MTKQDFIERQIQRGQELLSQIENMHLVRITHNNIGIYDDAEVEKNRNDVTQWQLTSRGVISRIYGENNQYTCDFLETISEKNAGFNFKRELKREVDKGLSVLRSIYEMMLFDMDNKEGNTIEKGSAKPPKVFISHKKEDKPYADALVNLINFVIGSDGDKIFCSSVQGYGIKLSRDIMDELKFQFDNYEIFMVIIHSPRYYQSPICLNEMGAAWVLGTRFSSFLTMDCKPEHMRGVINKEKIFIDPQDDSDQLNGHLNDFKDDLVELFGCNQPDENKWENARNRFIKEVSVITYPHVDKNNTDLFEHWYLPAFHHIFELLDLGNFQQWAYPCAIAGNTILKAYIYENLDQVPNYIMSRPRHKEYAYIDSLMRNLGLLINDFSVVYSQHAEKYDSDAYVVERFYKRIQNNPNYERDLDAYNEHVMLVSDMLFEVARLCNLILSRIREICPNYREDIGLLHIDMRITAPDLVYKESEISDSPYPGLKEYIKVRLTRETHLGHNPNIDESGYEN